MAQIAGGETDKRVFLFGVGQLMPTEPPASVHFELRLLRFEGLSPLTQHRRRSPLRPSVPTRDAGYDRCWHIASFRCDAMVRRLLEAKRLSQPSAQARL